MACFGCLIQYKDTAIKKTNVLIFNFNVHNDQYKAFSLQTNFAFSQDSLIRITNKACVV